MTLFPSPVPLFRRPLTSISRFLTREDGAVAIEAAIILPLLCFAYVAGFAYFDNYRRETLVTKATYTVADILSREEGLVTPADFEGLQDMFEFLTFSEGRTRLRFTQFQMVADELVVSSTVPGVQDTYATDGTLAMTDAQLETIRHRIPRLENGQVIVITESFTTHDPIFDIGLTAREYHRIAPTRNRIVTSLRFDLSTPAPVDEPTPRFDPSTLPAPTITLFDSIALLNAPDPEPVVATNVQPVGFDDPTGSDGDGNDGDYGNDDDGDDEEKRKGNNGHGNDADGNDDSNPGRSNDPDDHTDDDGAPGNGGNNGKGKDK